MGWLRVAQKYEIKWNLSSVLCAKYVPYYNGDGMNE